MEINNLPDDALVRAPLIRQLFGGISQDTLERRIKAGAIPAPQKQLGGRVNFWRLGAVRAALRRMSEVA
jgi:predicted DNA-binding transcriptional regulator AlpA